MARLFFLLPLFFYFNCHAQSHLGKSKNELLKIAEASFPRAETSYINDPDEGNFIRIINGYETIYYYFEDEVCVRFVVLKPYSCNCLETDIEAYKKNTIALGNLKWVSKDYKKLYQMKLKQEYYSLSVVPNTEHEPQIGSHTEYSDRGAY